LNRTLGLLDLAFGLQHIGAGGDQRRVHFGNLATGCFHGGFLPGAVQLEDHVALGNRRGEIEMHFGNAPRSFGKYRDCPEEQGRGVARWVEIEDQRNKRDREHQAGHDAIPQLEPYREQRDFLAETLTLHQAAVQIVRQDRQHRAENQLKHGRAPWLLTQAFPALPPS
jgi:hypothetical protein